MSLDPLLKLVRREHGVPAEFHGLYGVLFSFVYRKNHPCWAVRRRGNNLRLFHARFEITLLLKVFDNVSLTFAEEIVIERTFFKDWYQGPSLLVRNHVTRFNGCLLSWADRDGQTDGVGWGTVLLSGLSLGIEEVPGQKLSFYFGQALVDLSKIVDFAD